ncbi:PAS domain S-box protein [Noviherbaspirillum sedimenti]|uniref:PAS domain S-box protein n=1 Tax=Noviherbaspirillum sedimenti TaxID=2320865 RepID=A0A3A3FWS9_9BURK|nr:PAS domain S-box protein [Noviherbaspirillum sedimenti]RJG00683.1 PAS domain S-box protein [Noviherbaspirillum sedimenti]
MLSKSLKYSQDFLARLKWYYLDSLKGRLIVLSLGLSLTLLWTLVFFSTAVQQQKFSEVLFDQQLATARRLAADMDYKLQVRINVLTVAAKSLPDTLTSSIFEAHMAQETSLHRTFPEAIGLIGLDGRVIANYPAAPGRHGTYAGDHDFFKAVVETRQPYIGKPFMARTLEFPVLVIAVPVFDRAGKVRAVMTGVTNLISPSFLGAFFDKSIVDKQQFLVVSPRDNLILASTDPARVMTAPPSRGVDHLYDRLVSGVKRVGIDTHSNGTKMLASASYVHTTGWLAIAFMPADVAFRSVTIMRYYLIGMAAIMTLAAVFLVHWITLHMLVPFDEARQAIQRMTQGEIPLAPLTVKAKDEVGGIIDNFNVLVEDRRRGEVELRRSEQRLLALLEHAPDAMFVHTWDCFAYVNNATLHLFGAESPGQLLGQSILKRIQTSLHAVVKQRIRSVSEAKENFLPMELKLLRMDGSVVYARVSAMPFNYHGHDGLLVFARDITKRKRAEKALRASEERFRRLVALSSEWYWEHNENFVVTTVAGWREIKGGMIPEYSIGENPWKMGGIGSDEASWKAHRATVEARLPFTDFEYARQQYDGNVVWYSTSGEPMFDEHGDYKGYRGTGKDITERKLAEEALRQSQLRIRELAEHQEAIKEKERKRIARDLHDELGQTLLAIRLDATTLAEKTIESRPDHHKAARLILNHIDTAMTSVKTIINDLRPFVLDLGLLAAMEWQVHEFESMSGIPCDLEVDDEDCYLHLDASHSTALFRILQESLTNITRHAKARQVSIAIRTQDGQLVMTIADDGIGIGPDHRDKKSTFGLIGIEERINALGGKFSVSSNHGKGTTLRIAMPVSVQIDARC